MKSLSKFTALVICFLSASICQAVDNDIVHSVLRPSEPVLVDHGPVIVQPAQDIVDSVLNIPQDEPEFGPLGQAEFEIQPAPVELHSVPPAQQSVGTHPVVVCQKCQGTSLAACSCTCKPRKINTTVCLVDPSGCTHEVCVCVPACCVGIAPHVTWKTRKILGRKIAKLCWDCCEHDARVVITRRGKVRVTDR